MASYPQPNLIGRNKQIILNTKNFLVGYIAIIIIIIIIKKIGNARQGEGDCHPISPKTQAPHYQPIEEKKRKGK